MSQDVYDDDYQTGTDEQPDRNPLRDQLRKTEKALKEAREQGEANAKAARTLEFVKAGVPLTKPDGSPNPMASYFVNGYDGDLTPDAIKAAATEAGIISAPTQQVRETIPPAEADALRTMQESTADATQDGSRNWDAELASAKTEEEVIDLHRQRHGAESVKYD